MKHELTRMEIEPAENGGHTVTHYFKSKPAIARGHMESSYVEPEKHVFGEGEHKEMMGHIAEHLGLKAEHEPAEEEE